MSIGPDVWGPHGWKFLHFIALAYSNNPSEIDKQNYKIFFDSIGNILPCSLCSTHYKENLKNHPLTDEVLANRRNLLYWTIDMHNEVNKLNNKPEVDYITAIELIKNNFKESFENTISGHNNESDYAEFKISNKQINNDKINRIDKINKDIINDNSHDNKINDNSHNNGNNFFKYLILFIIITIIVIGLYLYKKNIV